MPPPPLLVNCANHLPHVEERLTPTRLTEKERRDHELVGSNEIQTLSTYLF